jgi:hypothetical protein
VIGIGSVRIGGGGVLLHPREFREREFGCEEGFGERGVWVRQTQRREAERVWAEV